MAGACSREKVGRILVARDELGFDRGKCSREDRRQRGVGVAERIDFGALRETTAKPSRDVPPEADRHRRPGDAGIRELRTRARRALNDDLARCASYTHELRARGSAQRVRLRVSEQTKQAIVIGDERNRVIDRARSAAGERGGFAGLGCLVEHECNPAQILDGVDGEAARRHCAVPGMAMGSCSA
ncbi:MAG TPA: hypothetical protein VMS45_07670 [Gemmatimonadaceae bacterium]|nr:hypothetical protein [Gemmatimonadaceae bacterium]